MANEMKEIIVIESDASNLSTKESTHDQLIFYDYFAHLDDTSQIKPFPALEPLGNIMKY